VCIIIVHGCCIVECVFSTHRWCCRPVCVLCCWVCLQYTSLMLLAGVYHHCARVSYCWVCLQYTSLMLPAGVCVVLLSVSSVHIIDAAGRCVSSLCTGVVLVSVSSVHVVDAAGRCVCRADYWTAVTWRRAMITCGWFRSRTVLHTNSWFISPTPPHRSMHRTIRRWLHCECGTTTRVLKTPTAAYATRLCLLTLVSQPPEARALCFCPVLFYLFIFIGLCHKVAGVVVHLGYLVLGLCEITQALEGGSCVNNVW